MTISPYLNFAGNCREVVQFYANVFHTEPPHFMTYAEGGDDPNFPMPEAVRGLIMHTRLMMSGTMVMFSDAWPGTPYTEGNNVSLAMVTRDREEILNAFNALKEGGEVIMDLQETSWAKLYGALKDKYGIEWQFSLDSGESFG